MRPHLQPPPSRASREPPQVEVVIEIPRRSFLKRGSTDHVDVISPVPCPFNYGAVPQYIGQEGDLLDAVVLGPRLARGTCVRVKAWGAVILTDRGFAWGSARAQSPGGHSRTQSTPGAVRSRWDGDELVGGKLHVSLKAFTGGGSWTSSSAGYTPSYADSIS